MFCEVVGGLRTRGETIFSVQSAREVSVSLLRVELQKRDPTCAFQEMRSICWRTSGSGRGRRRGGVADFALPSMKSASVDRFGGRVAGWGGGSESDWLAETVDSCQ